MQFGQFLDHDITLSPESEVHLEDCCVTEQDRLSEELQDKCFAVKVPEDDAQFNDRSGNRQASCSRPPHVTDRVGDFGVRSGGLCICKLMRPHMANWCNPHTYNIITKPATSPPRLIMDRLAMKSHLTSDGKLSHGPMEEDEHFRNECFFF